MKGYAFLVIAIAVVTIIYMPTIIIIITTPLKEVIKVLAGVNSMIG